MESMRTPEVEQLLDVFCKMRDKDDVYALLIDLFTVREIKETSKRLVVAKMFYDGKPYSFIEENTGVSAATIARVSKCLNYGEGGYHAALRILREE